MRLNVILIVLLAVFEKGSSLKCLKKLRLNGVHHFQREETCISSYNSCIVSTLSFTAELGKIYNLNIWSCEYVSSCKTHCQTSWRSIETMFKVNNSKLLKCNTSCCRTDMCNDLTPDISTTPTTPIQLTIAPITTASQYLTKVASSPTHDTKSDKSSKSKQTLIIFTVSAIILVILCVLLLGVAVVFVRKKRRSGDEVQKDTQHQPKIQMTQRENNDKQKKTDNYASLNLNDVNAGSYFKIIPRRSIEEIKNQTLNKDDPNTMVSIMVDDISSGYEVIPPSVEYEYEVNYVDLMTRRHEIVQKSTQQTHVNIKEDTNDDYECSNQAYMVLEKEHEYHYATRPPKLPPKLPPSLPQNLYKVEDNYLHVK